MPSDPNLMFDSPDIFLGDVFCLRTKEGSAENVSIILSTGDTSATSFVFITNFSNIHKQ